MARSRISVRVRKGLNSASTAHGKERLYCECTSDRGVFREEGVGHLPAHQRYLHVGVHRARSPCRRDGERPEISVLYDHIACNCRKPGCRVNRGQHRHICSPIREGEVLRITSLRLLCLLLFWRRLCRRRSRRGYRRGRGLLRIQGRSGDPDGANLLPRRGAAPGIAVWCRQRGVNWRCADVLLLGRTIPGDWDELDCVGRTLTVLEIVWPI
jgi:hypothetical protein